MHAQGCSRGLTGCTMSRPGVLDLTGVSSDEDDDCVLLAPTAPGRAAAPARAAATPRADSAPSLRVCECSGLSRWVVRANELLSSLQAASDHAVTAQGGSEAAHAAGRWLLHAAGGHRLADLQDVPRHAVCADLEGPGTLVCSGAGAFLPATHATHLLQAWTARTN